jgi:hypothetical protein
MFLILTHRTVSNHGTTLKKNNPMVGDNGNLSSKILESNGMEKPEWY